MTRAFAVDGTLTWQTTISIFVATMTKQFAVNVRRRRYALARVVDIFSFRETSTLACRVGLVDLLDRGYGACNNAGRRLTTRMALGRLIGWNPTTLRHSRCRANVANFFGTVMIEVGALDDGAGNGAEVYDRDDMVAGVRALRSRLARGADG
jgi:hypothetical protein